MRQSFSLSFLRELFWLRFCSSKPGKMYRKRDLITQRFGNLKFLYLITFECNYGSL
jgi:hypothetical protein